MASADTANVHTHARALLTMVELLHARGVDVTSVAGADAAALLTATEAAPNGNPDLLHLDAQRHTVVVEQLLGRELTRANVLDGALRPVIEGVCRDATPAEREAGFTTPMLRSGLSAGDRVAVFFLCADTACNMEVFTALVAAAKAQRDKWARILLVVHKSLFVLVRQTAAANQEAPEKEYWTYGELQHNPLKHQLVPRHRVYAASRGPAFEGFGAAEGGARETKDAEDADAGAGGATSDESDESDESKSKSKSSPAATRRLSFPVLPVRDCIARRLGLVPGALVQVNFGQMRLPLSGDDVMQVQFTSNDAEPLTFGASV